MFARWRGEHKVKPVFYGHGNKRFSITTEFSHAGNAALPLKALKSYEHKVTMLDLCPYSPKADSSNWSTRESTHFSSVITATTEDT